MTSLSHWLSPQVRRVWTETPGAKEVRALESFFDSTVQEYAQQPLEKLTLRSMLDFGRDAWYDQSKILESARMCQRELPKRLARRLLDLQLLPHIVVTNPHINRVYKAYHHAFETLRVHKVVKTMKDNEAFTALMRRLVDEHSPMLDSLAAGLRDCRQKPLVGDRLHLDDFLESMLRSRISRRVMAEQHLGLGAPRPGYVGIICTELSLAEAIDLAAQRCHQVCIETYGVAPEISINGDTDLVMAYIPAHIDYILYEILKNAARAVVERYQAGSMGNSWGSGLRSGGGRIPPLSIRICGGGDDVCIRVSDQGGGIPVDHVSRVFEFGFTTIEQSSTLEQPNEGNRTEGLGLDNRPHSTIGQAFNAAELVAGGGGRFRMAGLGFGLPLSRLYARYFGGDLTLVSLPGYGVDVYLKLQRLEGSDWLETSGEEHLPMGASHTQK